SVDKVLRTRLNVFSAGTFLSPNFVENDNKVKNNLITRITQITLITLITLR
ncbi:unnamed protein product, partial [marine sediment metagenome]